MEKMEVQEPDPHQELEKQPEEEGHHHHQERQQSTPVRLLYKSQLVIYTQRARLPLPAYLSINEALSSEPPRFRSSVVVGGVTYTSPNTFSHVKASEQDAARYALEAIAKKSRDEGWALIREDKLPCKSILNEFAVKMNLKLPSYDTERLEGLLPMFKSSLVFNGVTHAGEAGRSKKEAQQLAAKAALLSNLGTSESDVFLIELIKSKARLGLTQKSNNLHSVTSIIPGEIGTLGTDDHVIEVANGARSPPVTANSVGSQAQSCNCPPIYLDSHEFSKQKGEQASQAVELHITSAPSLNPETLADDLVSQKKRSRRNKKKAKKRARNEAQLPERTHKVSPCAAPLNQTSPWAVVQ